MSHRTNHDLDSNGDRGEDENEIRTERSSSIDSLSIINSNLSDVDANVLEAELNADAPESNEPLSQLHTSILTPTHDQPPMEGFVGTEVTLEQLNDVLPINNDTFEGAMKFMIRDNPFCEYQFNGDKDILWEIQIQGKFKRLPKGPVYLALELPQHEKFKVTGAIKLVIKASMQVMKAMGHKDVHISYGGDGELPHMGAPAFHSFDRVVITKEGEVPPMLGQHLPRTPSDDQRRKSFFKKNIIVDTTCTYTFSVKNRRFSPLLWKVITVPIIRTFNVSRFTESVRLSIYEVVEEKNTPIPDTKGNVITLAKKSHTKRNTFVWIQMSRPRQTNKA